MIFDQLTTSRRARVAYLRIFPLLSCILFTWLTSPANAEPPDFEGEVAPVLVRRCLECHQSSNASGNLALDTAEGLKKGGDSGEAVTLPSSGDCLLLHRVNSGEMPPAKHGESQKLPDAEIQILRRWIDSGASFPPDRRLDLYERTTDVRGGRDWWAFQPLRKIVPPVPSKYGSPANPIDAFILKSLEEQGLSPAPRAANEILLRRLYWDITGLPPSQASINQFSDANTPTEAGRNSTLESSDKLPFDAMVDQLLASPHFGERWARHWLDVVRYADTSGYERDQAKPFAWKYRDWVVNAFNNDMPYDEFIRQQLAGDELPNRTEQTVIATGFLRLGTWNDEPNDPEDYQYERLEDLVHATSSAFLGLTVKCARCHDHKFDPIPQVDYYRMAAAFWPGPVQARGRELIGGPSTEELGIKDVLGWTDVTTQPSPLHAFKNGERHHPLQEVSAASLSFAPGEFQQFTIAGADARTTGLRTQMANWIASPRNPLTARVIVNRLWQHHFGEGLVRSSNNFGYTGDKPTHPELLDWLATELIRHGWSLKHVHRLILTSKTWQQASIHPQQDQYNQRDSANRFLWRANRRRMEAESLRDSLLASSGELNLALGGPGFNPTISAEALEGLSRKASAWTASPEAEQHRRSLYIFTQRSLLPPLMTTFDMCDTTLPCGQRDVTIVAPQALTLLNNEFMHQRAESLATAVLERSSDDPSDRIREVWRSVLKRDPTVDESRLAIEHLERQQDRFAASISTELRQSIENSNAQEQLSTLLSAATLHLDASSGITATANGEVETWLDQGQHGHHAIQKNSELRPVLVQDAINAQPAVRFNGAGQFLSLRGQILSSDESSVFAVVTDRAAPGHRELLSNWNGSDGNIGSSYFIGLTNVNAVRFSDAFSGVGEVQKMNEPFLLTASNGPDGIKLFQQHRVIAEQSTRLPSRRLDTPWAIGQQGNINGEYWNGDLAMLLVFDRQLIPSERIVIQDALIERYKLPQTEKPTPMQPSAEQLSLASLCLVLFNSNEFAYID